jgi:hypothetical protein
VALEGGGVIFLLWISSVFEEFVDFEVLGLCFDF